MPANTFTAWLTTGGGQGSGADRQPPLGNGLEPLWRSEKDRMMAAWGRTPEAQYPDGYLGTAGSNSRRQDRLLNAVSRTQTRPYTRGVHKGERINPGDYMWPAEFNPMSGIENQARTGQRFPTGNVWVEPVRLVNDGKVGPRGIPSNEIPRPEVEIVNTARQEALRGLLPSWR